MIRCFVPPTYYAPAFRRGRYRQGFHKRAANSVYVAIGPVHLLRVWISECSTQADSSILDGVGLHSAKGGAVETGCSDLNGVIYYFTI